MAYLFNALKEYVSRGIEAVRDNGGEIAAGITAAMIIGGGIYYFSGKTLNNVVVNRTGKIEGHCGEFGEIECYTPWVEFQGIEGRFADQSRDGCYKFEEAEKITLQKGDRLESVTYRAPFTFFGDFVITETNPSKEKAAGRPTLGDRLFCIIR